jgi:SAM-dependent methyltransferase
VHKPLDQALSEAAALVSNPKTLVRAVLSGRRRNMQAPAERVDIRPVLLKGELHIQVMSNDGRATTTKNYLPNEFAAGELFDSGFANILVETTEIEYSLRISKKGEALVTEKKSSATQNLDHDRKKHRLLDPSDPFLIEIGISDKNGAVKPSRQDKFMQVEEFLRLLTPTLSAALEAGHIAAPTSQDPLHIVDLGCGHAYLTFAAHQYLRNEGMNIHVVGIDVREDSRKRNAEIAERLNISETIEFRAEEIAATKKSDVNVAIALHACDTATDDALAWAVKNDAELILAAPCCHHDMQAQLTDIPEPWSLVTRQGILKERLVDIMTDALRTQILRILGYRVEAIEFVGGEHTPRNLMIRAVKTGGAVSQEEIDRYTSLLAMWKVTPALATRLSAELSAAGVR